MAAYTLDDLEKSKKDPSYPFTQTTVNYIPSVDGLPFTYEFFENGLQVLTDQQTGLRPIGIPYNILTRSPGSVTMLPDRFFKEESTPEDYSVTILDVHTNPVTTLVSSSAWIGSDMLCGAGDSFIWQNPDKNVQTSTTSLPKAMADFMFVTVKDAPMVINGQNRHLDSADGQDFIQINIVDSLFRAQTTGKTTADLMIPLSLNDLVECCEKGNLSDRLSEYKEVLGDCKLVEPHCGDIPASPQPTPGGGGTGSTGSALTIIGIAVGVTVFFVLLAYLYFRRKSF